MASNVCVNPRLAALRCLLAVTFAAGPVSAQIVALPPNTGTTETNSPPIIPFLEGTDVFWTLQGGEGDQAVFPNRLEADIFPHLVVSQNFTNVLDITAQARKGPRRFREFAYSISGTPAVRIRMLRDVSAPVRTPSYMPRVNVQFLWTRGLKDCVDGAGTGGDCRAVAAPSAAQAKAGGPASAQAVSALAALVRISIWEGHFIVGHHSNGQDGCLTRGQVRVPPETGDCQPPAVPTAETINRRDGSFSTNYIRAGMNYSRNRMTEALEAVREARLRAEFEYHPRAWVDDDIVEIFGRARLNLSGAYAAKNVPGCRRRLEGSAGLVWNPGVVETVTELSGLIQASCFPWDNGGWGFFVRLYSGQDYYNIGFLDKITRLHFGATFNQTGFFRFRRPAARE
jgi:hypothetical protein